MHAVDATYSTLDTKVGLYASLDLESEDGAGSEVGAGIARDHRFYEEPNLLKSMHAPEPGYTIPNWIGPVANDQGLLYSVVRKPALQESEEGAGSEDGAGSTRDHRFPNKEPNFMKSMHTPEPGYTIPNWIGPV